MCVIGFCNKSWSNIFSCLTRWILIKRQVSLRQTASQKQGILLTLLDNKGLKLSYSIPCSYVAVYIGETCCSIKTSLVEHQMSLIRFITKLVVIGSQWEIDHQIPGRHIRRYWLLLWNSLYSTSILFFTCRIFHRHYHLTKI